MRCYVRVIIIALALISFTLPSFCIDSDPTSPRHYAGSWLAVDTLIKNGLTKTAFDTVSAIYKKASGSSNSDQIIKSIIYRMRLESFREEDAFVKAMDRLNEEIKTSVFPATPLLHSMLAECYLHYYQNNRWNFFNRTHVETPGSDIHTWDLRTIMDKITTEFRLSLVNPDKLKAARTDIFGEAISDSGTEKKIRPTLFDFLAYRAIDFFSMSDDGLTKPAEEFTLNSEKYFKPFNEFSKLDIVSNDSLSLRFLALKILRELVIFHLKADDTAALMDADIKRLSFVRQNSSMPEKDSLYLAALMSIKNYASLNPASAEAAWYIAMLYKNRADTYIHGKYDQYRWMNKDALRLCNEAMKAFPESYGAKLCANLSGLINEKSMTFSCENVNVPGKPFEVLLSYKNITGIYWRLIKIDIDDYQRLVEKNVSDSVAIKLSMLKPVKEWSAALPDPGDFQSHSVVLDVPALNAGHYVLLCASDPEFRPDSQTMAYSDVQVSMLSFIERPDKNNNREFIILDRETGLPVKGVAVKVWNRVYEPKTREYKPVLNKTFVANADGSFIINPSGGNYNDCIIDFSLKNDFLRTGNYYITHNAVQIKSMDLKTFFFTDRAIYRPGQTIYFKGILLKTDGEKSLIAPKEKTSVIFYDVHRQETARLNLTSNDFGSVNGFFIVPQNTLNGNMSIGNESGNVDVLVEEYKRPKFEVTMNPFKGIGKLEDSIEYRGTALSYAGNAITGAKVSYRVVRQARLPVWSCWRPPVWRSEAEITNGIAVTNDTGGFVIKFKAIPDRTIPKKENPVFTYRILVDVTDIAGETHSSSASINIGYSSMSLAINAPERMNRESDTVLSVSTANLNGVFEPAKGTISIYKLKTPSKVSRNRPGNWNMPDTAIISASKFESLFPTDRYSDENDSTKWEKTGKIFETGFDTRLGKEIKLPLFKWKQGVYVLEGLAKDSLGREVKDIKYFILFSEKEKSLPRACADWFVPVKTECEPGGKAVFIVGSGYENVKILFEAEHKGEIIHREWLTVSNSQTRTELPVEEKYRGNFSAIFIFVRDNRIYRHDAMITVPWTNKELDISFETFRSKLTPGENEEWRVKLSGKKCDKIVAEMVATLYDASLDAFTPLKWDFKIYPTYNTTRYWNSGNVFDDHTALFFEKNWNNISDFPLKKYPELNWFGYNFEGSYMRRGHSLRKGSVPVPMAAKPFKAGYDGGNGDDIGGLLGSGGLMGKKEMVSAKSLSDFPEEADTADKPQSEGNSGQNLFNVKTRTNLNETAFFYPLLQTNDSNGIVIRFKMPEALTKWKMMGFAHTRDLKYGMISKELVTQKTLMIMPHLPRFLREGDKIKLTATVANIADKALSGSGRLMLFDAATAKSVDSLFYNTNPEISFTTAKGKSALLSWNITVPQGTAALTVKMAAKASGFSDAEENVLPVLSNRMLVTESVPLSIRKKGTKKFILEKLISKNNGSTTAVNHKLTLEFASDPVWYAIQALPSIMEYSGECSERAFNGFYANSIAAHIANSSPRIKSVFDQWRNLSSDALISNLEKNTELKAIALEETPWLLDGRDESERKKRLGVLFDLNTMAANRANSLEKLKKLQMSNGGWPWFEGMPDDRFITQYIAIGLGRLLHIGIINSQKADIDDMLGSCLHYLDDRIAEDYRTTLTMLSGEMDKNHISELQIQYLYMRSFFRDIGIDNKNRAAFDYYMGQSKKYWVDNSRYLQGMIALALARNSETRIPAKIIASLRENAVASEEMGMYWKEMYEGDYRQWHRAPIESQALMIEAFDEIAHDTASVEELKTWLIKSKQTQNWGSTKATAEACFALLLRGQKGLEHVGNVKINLGDTVIDQTRLKNAGPEAGTGYFKMSWNSADIKPDMGNIAVAKNEPGVAWGALYLQYFEQLDKIKQHDSPLKIIKKMFVKNNSAKGPVISPVDSTTKLRPGDMLTVRMELRVDRDMEYVHIKDMRASGLEPTSAISGYKWQDGLGYYESFKNASVNFFISYLRKGTYIFEYPLVAAHAGDFSNGITNVQCMYAPEFSSHSKGIKIKIN